MCAYERVSGEEAFSDPQRYGLSVPVALVRVEESGNEETWQLTSDNLVAARAPEGGVVYGDSFAEIVRTWADLHPDRILTGVDWMTVRSGELHIATGVEGVPIIQATGVSYNLRNAVGREARCLLVLSPEHAVLQLSGSGVVLVSKRPRWRLKPELSEILVRCTPVILDESHTMDMLEAQVEDLMRHPPDEPRAWIWYQPLCWQPDWRGLRPDRIAGGWSKATTRQLRPWRWKVVSVETQSPFAFVHCLYYDPAARKPYTRKSKLTKPKSIKHRNLYAGSLNEFGCTPPHAIAGLISAGLLPDFEKLHVGSSEPGYKAWIWLALWRLGVRSVGLEKMVKQFHGVYSVHALANQLEIKVRVQGAPELAEELTKELAKIQACVKRLQAKEQRAKKGAT